MRKSDYFLGDKSGMMGTRRTRIERIYADFDPAFGVMCWPQILAPTLFALANRDTNEVSVQFVKIC